jgi:trk system potassium uptake protein TrkH
MIYNLGRIIIIMDYRTVASYIGTFLEILGILILLPVFVSWFFGDGMHTGFFIGAVLSFIIGMGLDRKFKKEELTLSSAMVIAGLSFIVVSLVGALPYLFYLNPVDAWFEAVSGFTTTGLTVVNPELLPPSLLFWRALTQWVGGIGIIIIFLMTVSSPGMSSYYLYKAEGGAGMIGAGVRGTVRRVMMIYLTYTMIGVLLFAFAGMPLFESVLNSITGIATGGFTTREASIGAFGNPYIEVVAILLMVLGATSFFVHAKLWNRKLRDYLRNPETRLFWSILLIFSLLMAFSYVQGPDPFRHGIFQTFSALTGTGFYNAPITSGLTMILLIGLMIIGGYAGSTAGGLKLVRSGIILKSLPWLGKKISLPEEAVVPFKMGGRVIKDSELSIIALFVTMYLVVLGASSLGLTILGYSPLDSVFTVASAEGTVGLSVIPIQDMHPNGKIILIANMFLGRLEIIPFLVMAYILISSLVDMRKRELAFRFFRRRQQASDQSKPHL